MSHMQKMEALLGIVGLLRGKFSQIMRIINQNIEDCKARRRYPSAELISLMTEAQELFAGLLKTSEFLSTSIANISDGEKDAFDFYMEEWIVTQTAERFRAFEKFLRGIAHPEAPGLAFDERVWKEGLALVREGIGYLQVSRAG